MKMKCLMASLAAILAVGMPVKATVVVSEVIYNPHGTEQLIEWMEIFNTGNSSVDISGWYVTDGDLGADDTLPTCNMTD